MHPLLISVVVDKPKVILNHRQATIISTAFATACNRFIAVVHNTSLAGKRSWTIFEKSGDVENLLCIITLFKSNKKYFFFRS